MKLFKTLLTILVISLLSSTSWSVTFDDSVERNDLYYEKFTNVPFSGKVTGKYQGVIKNGKEEGAWVWYYKSGQVEVKENYKNGKLEGARVNYWSNGGLLSEGNYKNDKKEGVWIGYFENGQLSYKGTWKYNMKEGVWVGYNENGNVFKPDTGTFKDGKKISD